MKPRTHAVSARELGLILLLVGIAFSTPAMAIGRAMGRGALVDIPPSLVMDESYATGVVIRTPGGTPEVITVQIRDSLSLQTIFLPPRDTIPSGSRIEFRWHGEPAPGGYPVAGYEYRLDETTFVSVDSSVRSVSYNTGVGGDVIAPGYKLFTLRVFDSVGNARDMNRRFYMNYAPDTWFSGPDTTLYPKEFPNDPFSERFITVSNWRTLPPQMGSLLSCDSITVMPSSRVQRKSFFEIYQNRLYVHSEGDTVRMNSWVLFHGGGFDLDSPYGVFAFPEDPDFPDTTACLPEPTRVLTPAPPNGSPIGFKFLTAMYLSPAGPPSTPSYSLLALHYGPATKLRQPSIGNYAAMIRAGKMYAVLRAEDGDGLDDARIEDPRDLADRVDAGLGTPEERALRSRILTFYVDRPPRLLFTGAFSPLPNDSFFTTHLHFNLLADDTDPYDPGNRPTVGGPSNSKVIRYTVSVKGKNALGETVIARSRLPGVTFSPQVTIDLPPEMVSRNDTVQVQLCDCIDCELLPGQGRCVDYAIPIRVMTGTTPTLASLIDFEATPAHVRMRWMLGAASTTRVERRTASLDWITVGDVHRDGTGEVVFDDTSVEPGTRYAYRLMISVNGETIAAGETWVDVPRGTEFALRGLTPNPGTARNLTVRFSLASGGPARIDLLDTSGRRWIARDLGSLEPGNHSIALNAATRIPPGVYLIRLAQGNQARVARAVVIE